eukprot:TRINITY_DN6006_c0_g1_i3.p1 TRINITY_DN6006_c0_g1~~TRINITY_DN6006_c0_g1_i3.p1  ORF type:complete len:232 (-),score=-28.05 TRINITY_DN6006_c0_g1_i3:35-730(-)
MFNLQCFAIEKYIVSDSSLLLIVIVHFIQFPQMHFRMERFSQHKNITFNKVYIDLNVIKKHSCILQVQYRSTGLSIQPYLFVYLLVALQRYLLSMYNIHSIKTVGGQIIGVHNMFLVLHILSYVQRICFIRVEEYQKYVQISCRSGGGDLSYCISQQPNNATISKFMSHLSILYITSFIAVHANILTIVALFTLNHTYSSQYLFTFVLVSQQRSRLATHSIKCVVQLQVVH